MMKSEYQTATKTIKFVGWNNKFSFSMKWGFGKMRIPRWYERNEYNIHTMFKKQTQYHRNPRTNICCKDEEFSRWPPEIERKRERWGRNESKSEFK